MVEENLNEDLSKLNNKLSENSITRVSNNWLFIITRNLLALMLVGACVFQVTYGIINQQKVELETNLVAMTMMVLGSYYANRSEDN